MDIEKILSDRPFPWAILQSITIAALAYLAGYYFTGLFHAASAPLGGLWAVISGLVVTQASRRETISSAKFRVMGSMFGALVAGIYLLFFHFSLLGYLICLGMGALICYLFRVPAYVKLTWITISIVMIVSTLSKDIDPIQNAALRFVESVLGTLVAVVVALAMGFKRKSVRDVSI